VTVANTQTGITSNITTNASGIYDALSLLPGDYSITFAAQGFGTQRRSVNLQAQVITVDAKLTVGSNASEIVVSAASPLLETEGPEVDRTLTTATVDARPHVGQSWLNYTNTLPGVTVRIVACHARQSSVTIPEARRLRQIRRLVPCLPFIGAAALGNCAMARTAQFVQLDRTHQPFRIQDRPAKCAPQAHGTVHSECPVPAVECLDSVPH
jgi:hypothetical protein